jgi:hypothetical protein
MRADLSAITIRVVLPMQTWQGWLRCSMCFCHATNELHGAPLAERQLARSKNRKRQHSACPGKEKILARRVTSVADFR